MTSDLEFIHVYQPPASASAQGFGVVKSEAPTFLILHGTGGDEHDLLPIARMLDPSAGVLSPRGKILERGMPRFFRRLAEGVFDIDDLKFRTSELADFASAAADRYGFDPARVIAAGFSNGANIAASMLLLRPGVLRAAILFSAMLPLEPVRSPDLRGVDVFMREGQSGPFVDPSSAQRLADLLRTSGANVTLQWKPGGHELTRDDVEVARTWYKSLNVLTK